jgi:undecaprenyl diphosphate synthase
MNDLIIPNHVGIIMDGNGRWAQERGQIRTFGHKKGAENLKKLCIYMKDKGVKYISLYAFSTENFKREAKEVNFLMSLFMKVFTSEKDFIMDNKIRVLFSGRREPLPKNVLDSMDELMEETKDFDGATMNICLNYGSVYEIVDTTKKICEMYKNGDIELEDITKDFIQKNLYQDLPPLDFVIRTSGELRLSNFMMYQASYAEFYFPSVYFPDFDEKEFDKALLAFNHRDRRFGGIKNEG